MERGKIYSAVVYVGRDDDGKKKYKWVNCGTRKRDAERILNELVHSLNKGDYVPDTGTTVADCLNQWLEHCDARAGVGTDGKDLGRGGKKLSGKTVERYREIVELHLIPALGTIGIQKLRPRDIQNYYTRALTSGRIDKKGGLSSRTVRHHHRVLHSALESAIIMEDLVTNPVKRVIPPDEPDIGADSLTMAEVHRLLDGVEGTRLHIPVVLALSTGMRRGELVALRWDLVHLDEGTLEVVESVEQTKSYTRTKEPKTKNAKRTILLDKDTVELLRGHKKQQAAAALLQGPHYVKSDIVCTRENGSAWPPDALSNAYGQLATRLKLHTTSFHKLRHTHASLIGSEGAHPSMVCERLGHSTPAITLRLYTAVLPSLQQQAPGMLMSALEKARACTDSEVGLAGISKTA